MMRPFISQRSLIAMLLAVLLGLAGGGTLEADCSIDFDNLDHGVSVAQQYRNCGVIFAGAPGDPLPQVYDFSSVSGSKVLHSHDWYAPIVVSIIDPTNTNIYRPVSYIEFDNPSTGDYLHIEVFAANGSLIGSYSSVFESPETVVLDFGQPIAASMVIDDLGGTSFVVDNLAFFDESPIFRGRFETGGTWRWSGETGVPVE